MGHASFHLDRRQFLQAGALAGLKASDAGDRREQVTSGRGSATVAVQGKAAMRIRATDDAEKVLEGRDRVVASLAVTVTDGDGERAVVRRWVVLSRGDA